MIRFDWQPWMGRVQGWKPYELEDLTPYEIELAEQDATANPGIF